jgi:hypothetical protein
MLCSSGHIHTPSASGSRPESQALHPLPLVQCNAMKMGHGASMHSRTQLGGATTFVCVARSARDNDALSIRRILEESPTDPSYVLRSRTTAETPLHVHPPPPPNVCGWALFMWSHIMRHVGAACCKSWKCGLHSTTGRIAQTPSRGMLQLTCYGCSPVCVWMCRAAHYFTNHQDVNEESFQSRWTPLVSYTIIFLYLVVVHPPPSSPISGRM